VFVKGLILGLSVAAPIGPINLLCIQRTLSRGRLHGFVSGLGAATADTLFAVIAALGLTTISSFMVSQQFWLQLGGGFFLVYVGLKIALSPPSAQTGKSNEDPGLARAYGSILLLMLANPATLLLFFAVLAALGISPDQGGLVSVLQLICGVFTGSAIWWWLLSLIAEQLRGHLTDGRMRLVNLTAGLAILVIAVWSLWPAIHAKLL
jgi:threonine/homoserine/homoserine lactone efflux protein